MLCKIHLIISLMTQLYSDLAGGSSNEYVGKFFSLIITSAHGWISLRTMPKEDFGVH